MWKLFYLYNIRFIIYATLQQNCKNLITEALIKLLMLQISNHSCSSIIFFLNGYLFIKITKTKSKPTFINVFTWDLKKNSLEILKKITWLYKVFVRIIYTQNLS